MNPIRVLIVDDHVLFREGLAGIINAQEDMRVIGEAGDGLEAIVKAAQLKPDLVLLDIEMPAIDGVEAAAQIRQENPKVVIVMLTVRDDHAKLFQAIKSGAQGYLLKNIRSADLVEMLRGALRGEAALSPLMAANVLEEFRRLSRKVNSKPGEELVELTQREQEVIDLIATGKSDKEIAEILTISLHTAKSHVRNILAKLQANNRREAAAIAREQGWV
jgi:DNA-binding NarL/FixJ family response regulator